MLKIARWIVAAAAVGALVYATVPMVPSSSADAEGSGLTCPAGAKKANLDFTVSDMNGQICLSSFKGKVIVLDFWATWCPPCKAEIPRLCRAAAGLWRERPADRRRVGGRHARQAEALRRRVQDELPGAGRPRPRRPAGCLRADVGHPDDLLISRDGRICPRIPALSARRSTKRISRACCSKIRAMLKGFTHARLACGGRARCSAPASKEAP